MYGQIFLRVLFLCLFLGPGIPKGLAFENQNKTGGIGLQFDITSTKRNGHQVSLKNNTEEAIYFFHHKLVNPISVKLIKSGDEQPISLYDLRALKKYDNTPYLDQVQELKSGQVFKIDYKLEYSGTKSPGFEFGVYSFDEPLPPGEYKFQLEYENQIQQFLGSPEGKNMKKTVWTGILKSEWIKFVVQ